MLNIKLFIPCYEETTESTIVGAVDINHKYYQCMVFLRHNGPCYIFLEHSIVQKEHFTGPCSAAFCNNYAFCNTLRIL